MTAPTWPLTLAPVTAGAGSGPTHGTVTRARGVPRWGVPRCPCRPCRDAENAYNKRRRYLKAIGRSITVPSDQAAKHVHACREAGDAWDHLASQARCSVNTLERLAAGDYRVIRRDLAERILAVTPGKGVPPTRSVPAVGSIRRVRALMAIGVPCKTIAAAAGMSETALSKFVNGRVESCALHVAERIAGAYRELCGSPGESVRNRRRAEREGWGSPLAWDDIDDPKSRPARTARSEAPYTVDWAAAMRALEGERIELGPRERTAAVELGMRRGMKTEDIARELGMTEDAVERSWERVKERAAAAGLPVPHRPPGRGRKGAA